MSVSPQDFALWSQMTGRPYPQSPAERMALAPEVYSYTRSIGRRGGPTMGPIRRTVDVIGKAALAAGALAGAGYLASKYGGENPPPPPTGFGALALDTEPEVHPPEARYTPDVNSDVARNSGDITAQPTSGHYHQNLNINQTGIAQDLKGLSPQKPTQVPSETKTATQNDVITTSQSFRPGTEEDQLIGSAVEKAIAFRKSKAYAAMQRTYPGLQDTDTEMLGGVETTPAAVVSPVVVVQPEVRPAGPVIGTVARNLAQQGTPLTAEDYSAIQQGKASPGELRNLAAAVRASAGQIPEKATKTLQAHHDLADELEFNAAQKEATQPKVADLLEAKLHEAAQSDARLYRSAGQHIGEMKKKVNELQEMQPAPARGPNQDEIRDLDTTLLRSHSTLNRIQREDLRNQILNKKYGEQSEPDYVSTGETVSTGMQVGAPKEFLRQKVAEIAPLDAARQNIAIRKQLSAPTTEFQNLGYSAEKSDKGEYDPQYQNLLQSHLDRSMRSGQVEPGSAAHLAQLAAFPGGEESTHYQKAYGRAFPAHFQY